MARGIGRQEVGPSMPDRLRAAAKRIVGVKQTLKALEKGRARVVYIARDAEAHVVQPVLEACQRRGLEPVYVDTMKDLGRHCQIDVGAATAALVDE